MPASISIREIQGRLRVAKILWFGLLMTVVIYGFVLCIAARPGPDTGEPIPLLDPANLGIYVVGVVIVFVAFRVSDLFVSRERLARAFAQPWTAESLAALTDENGKRRYTAEQAAELADVPESQRQEIQAMSPYVLSRIVRYGMFDAAALLGFMRAFTGHSPTVYLPSGLIALVGFLLSIPREEDVVELIRRAGPPTI